MSTLDRWLEAACRELGIDPLTVDVKAVLDLARDTARGVDRPAAPLTAYLLGMAVGRGASPAATTERLSAMARDWAARQPPDAAAGT